MKIFYWYGSKPAIRSIQQNEFEKLLTRLQWQQYNYYRTHSQDMDVIHFRVDPLYENIWFYVGDGEKPIWVL